MAPCTRRVETSLAGQRTDQVGAERRTAAGENRASERAGYGLGAIPPGLSGRSGAAPGPISGRRELLMSTREGAARQTLTVEEAAALLGIGRNSAYQAVASG